MKQYILASGQAGSGKDVLSNHLAKQLNSQLSTKEQFFDAWPRIGFALAVKSIFMQTFQVDNDFIEAWKRRDEIPPGFDTTVRKSLQQIGDGFRKIKGDIWIDLAFRNRDRAIISDGRYFNEARATKDRDGINVLLWRPGFENDDPNPSESQIKPIVDFFVKTGKEGATADIFNHCYDPIPQEAYLFDFFIRNEGSLDDLYRKADRILIPYINQKFAKFYS